MMSETPNDGIVHVPYNLYKRLMDMSEFDMKQFKSIEKLGTSMKVKLCKDCPCPVTDHKREVFIADDGSEKNIILMTCKRCKCQDVIIQS